MPIFHNSRFVFSSSFIGEGGRANCKRNRKFFSLTDTQFPILFVKKEEKKEKDWVRTRILIRQIKVFNRQTVSTGENLYVTANKPVFSEI